MADISVILLLFVCFVFRDVSSQSKSTFNFLIRLCIYINDLGVIKVSIVLYCMYIKEVNKCAQQ